MIRKILQYFLPFESPAQFPDTETRHQFLEWGKPSRFIQTAAITFLTALLYILFTFLDRSWAPAPIQSLMTKFHLMVLVPLLLLISLLAFQKRHYQLMMTSLCLFPLVSMSAHAYIASQFTNNTIFLAEGYLGIVWIFLISGMSFNYAMVSATLSCGILLISGYFFIPQPAEYPMHVFWLFCSYSFGLLGALILDRTRKAIFFSQQELHRLAITDELTGVFNRNKFHQVFAAHTERELRQSPNFALLMVDIDHFKSINDNFGHEMGDRVLCQTAQILASATRQKDTLVRWGGEEFVIIALDVDAANLQSFCEKLRMHVEQQHFPEVNKITVSIGATLFAPDDSSNNMLSRADKALYQAKASGRNNSVIV